MNESPPSRKLQIAVIGSASEQLPEEQRELAYQAGRWIVQNQCRLLCGGMGGVMALASQGAHAADGYCSGDVIGVLPSYDKGEANPYIDVVLSTGLGVARNTVLMASCDAVIALDGGAGTLSEIALAWQMQKPIACLGDRGWHQRLSCLQLDTRRDDELQLLSHADGVAAFIRALRNEPGTVYRGIQAKQS